MLQALVEFMKVAKDYAPVSAAIVAACAAGLVWWNARNARRGTAANLLLTLMKDYRSEEFAEGMRLLRYFKEHSNHARGFAADYAERVRTRDATVADLRTHRRLVAHYFNTLRALCSNNLLDRRLVADAFGKGFFEFYLEVLEPMDSAEANLRPGPHESSRSYFEALVRECFPSR